MPLTLMQRLKLLGRAAVGIFSSASAEQAYGMLAGILPGGVGKPPKRGTLELLKAYNEMPWLRAVVNKVGRSVASTSWQLYAVKRGGKAVKAARLQRADYLTRRRLLAGYRKQAELVEIEEHPLLDLMDSANSFLTGLVARQLTQQHLDLVGEAFWLKERNGAGKPVVFWPLPPNWVIGTPTPAHPFFRVSFRAWQGEIPDTEILWIADPDPTNPYGRGSGTGRALADELETDEYAAKHTKSWFYNRARPDLVISGDGLRPEDTARLEEDWLRRHQGFWKAFKPYFLSKKVDIQTLSQTFENMQLVDLRKYERDTIIQVYGVPPEILGIIENSNRATIEAADFLFARWVVQPRLEFLRVVLQERLVPEFDDRLILDYESPVSEDKEHKLNVARAAPWSLTVDEWREMQGREPLPDGQGRVYMLPFNVYPSRTLAGQPQEQPAPPGSEEPPPQASAGRQTGRGGRTKAINPDDIKKLLAAVALERLTEQMLPAYRDIVAAFGQDILDTVGMEIRFDLLDPRVAHFLDSEAGQYIQGINGTTVKALRAQLVEGVEAGESIPRLADRVSAVFADAKDRRAVTIARTEVVRASNFGGWAGMKQGGIEEKEWLATRDDRVRDSHLEADGQIQPIDRPFTLGSGAQAMYPGDTGEPEEDINCRCTTAPVLNSRSMYDTEEKRAAAWRKYEASLRPWERRMETAAKKAFQEQQNAVMAELKRLAREGSD